MFENIADPYGREMNYPRIWQCLFWLPINSDHLVILAGTFILLFFVGIFLFLKTIDTQIALFLGAVTFSPSAIFGLQSGNNDLVVFFCRRTGIEVGLPLETLGISRYVLRSYPEGISTFWIGAAFDRK